MFVLRAGASLAAVIALTWIAHAALGVNATTAGFAYLVVVLLIASTWGFAESAIASFAAALAFNYYFLPPIGTFTISDPQNWAALAAFLTTSLVASRLSAVARRRAAEAIERQADVERLYTFSRSILLIDAGQDFPKKLVDKLAEIFSLDAAVLFDRRAGEFLRAGPSEFEGLDDHLRDAALNGTSFFDAEGRRAITAVRLGSEPIASLGLQGAAMEDSVLQGVANLVAIGLERARSQELAQQIEAARQSEQLRTTLIDAMAHELKTPLTSIRAATSALLATPDQSAETRTELLRIADEEADHLRALIDDAIELARLDTSRIDVQLEPADLGTVVRETVDSLRKETDGRSVTVACDAGSIRVLIDYRLIKVAIKQLVDNAMKYSPPGSPVGIEVRDGNAGMKSVEITNEGPGIAAKDQAHVFERFWRGPSTKTRTPGTGLGLSIAKVIALAHHGDLEFTSRPGKTTFRLAVPGETRGD